MEHKPDLLETAANISTIPTLPTVISRITSLLQNPQTSADEIGKAITTDQALASKVLKLVNSAFYGFPGRISTITHAVVILGFSTVKNIVLTASIFEAFKKESDSDAVFDMEKFWFHSIACGAASQTIAKKMGLKSGEECFIAGLIHDVGKVILCQYMPEQFHKVVKHSSENNCLFYDAEKALFANTHQEVGGFLAEKWNLPTDLQNAVKYHHMPSNRRTHYEMTAVVHSADILVRAMGYGNGGDNRMPVIDDDVWNYLKLSSQTLPSLFEEIDQEVEKATIFLQV